MKRFQPLVFSAALLLLAACGQDAQPEAAAPSFNFSIDPGGETVSLQGSGAAALSTLTYGVCGLDDPRPLLPEGELALTAYNAVFLPGNILEITAEFTNVTGFDFEQPFTFTRAGLSRNIVSSQEPEVTDANLGGDGVLSPDETTSTLTFTVEHMGQPFTYKVLAEAVVDCGDGSGEPTDPTDPVDPVDPDGADLEVIKSINGEVTFGEDGGATANFTVIVRNNGTLDAENVVLTDTLTIDLADLVGVDATITAGTILPVGCSVDVLDGSIIICDIGTVAGGTEQEFDFSFDIDLLGELPASLEGITITNEAEVVTDTEEADLENNIDIVVTVPSDGGPVLPGEADLEVVKTLAGEVILDADGNATATFSIVVTNNGTVDAENVVLTDTLVVNIADLLGVNATVTASTTLPVGCSLSVAGLNIVICDLGTVAAGASTELELSFDLGITDIPAGVTTITVTNTADVSTDTPDSDDTNNTIDVDADVTVPAPVPALLPDLTVTKTGDTAVTTGEDGTATLNYSVTVTNNGEAIAEGVELTDNFLINLDAFDGLVTVDATVLPMDSNCVVTADATAPGTLVAICPLGALAAGESSTLDFSFTVDLPTTVVAADGPFAVTNTAAATTTTEEDNLLDNTAVVEATVTVPDPVLVEIPAAGI